MRRLHGLMQAHALDRKLKRRCQRRLAGHQFSHARLGQPTF